jgi:transposase
MTQRGACSGRDFVRQLYGRRSEKTPANQLQLLLSFFTQQQSAVPQAVPATADGAQAAAPAAPPAAAHLERREVLVPPAAEECLCPGCGQQSKPMGEEDFRRYLVVDGYKGYLVVRATRRS